MIGLSLFGMTLFPSLWALYKGLQLEKYSECFSMCGAILKGTNSSFQKGMTFCRSIYVKKVMKLLAFIFEQSSNNSALQV